MSAIGRLRNWWIKSRLDADVRAVRDARLTYLSPPKLLRLQQSLATVTKRGVPGDLIEFGVALGGSGILIARHAKGERHFHGFDVFAMIPPPTSEKDDAKSRERYDRISSGGSVGINGDLYYGYRDNLFDEVKASFAEYGCTVEGDRVQLHKGLFEDSWPTASVGPVAFAHIDCDWYDPVKYCLEAVADKISPGGMLLIDDYNDYGGARTAVDEFLAKRRDFRFEPGANPILRKVAAG